MISLQITDIKHFMSALLSGTTFDNFLVSEVTISTYNNFIFDGHINSSYYTDEELQTLENPKMVLWEKLKPICYDLIKGKKLPLKFKIIFFLDDPAVLKLLESSESSLPIDNINGLCINVKYENSSLICTTGTSLNVFTIDRTLENCFDLYVKKLFSDMFNAEQL